MSLADGLGEGLGGDVLEEIADGAGLQGTLDQVLFLETGEGDDLNFGILPADGLGHDGSVHVRHHHVHEDNIGLEFCAELDGMSTAAGLPHEFQVIKSGQEEPQSLAEHGVVIYQHDTDSICSGHCTLPS